MSSASDFIIENGVLKKYVGPGGDVTIPEGVTSIGDCVFHGCSSLISIAIPDGVTSIGVLAFSGCKNLASITIPNSMTNIGRSVFDRCESLTNIAIADSVTSIGEGAFSKCSNLTTAYKMIQSNEIKSLRIGRSIRIPKDCIVDYIRTSCYNDGRNELLPSEKEV